MDGGNIKIRVMYWKTRNVQVVLKRCGGDMKKAIDFRINYDGPLDANRMYTEVRPKIKNVYKPRVRRRRLKKVS